MVNEEDCFVPTPENTNTYEATVRVENPKILKAARLKVARVFRENTEKEAESIPF